MNSRLLTFCNTPGIELVLEWRKDYEVNVELCNSLDNILFIQKIHAPSFSSILSCGADSELIVDDQ
jgi:hypothetical protein